MEKPIRLSRMIKQFDKADLEMFVMDYYTRLENEVKSTDLKTAIPNIQKDVYENGLFNPKLAIKYKNAHIVHYGWYISPQEVYKKYK